MWHARSFGAAAASITDYCYSALWAAWGHAMTTSMRRNRKLMKHCFDSAGALCTHTHSFGASHFSAVDTPRVQIHYDLSVGAAFSIIPTSIRCTDRWWSVAHVRMNVRSFHVMRWSSSSSCCSVFMYDACRAEWTTNLLGGWRLMVLLVVRTSLAMGRQRRVTFCWMAKNAAGDHTKQEAML